MVTRYENQSLQYVIQSVCRIVDNLTTCSKLKQKSCKPQ